MLSKRNDFYNIDIESKIMDCWSVINDIQILNEAVLEKDLTTDQISNVLLGLESLYELKFQRLFEDYKKLVQSGKLLQVEQ
jgi:hypothetical protein